MLLHTAEIVFCCCPVALLLCLICFGCFAVIPFHVIAVVSVMTDITVITVVSVLLFHALTVILFQVFSCYIWSAVLTVILFHLFCCFTDSIPMIIVKKIQIPNIFYRFSKKYYYCHNFHSISADLPGFWRKIPFLPLFLYIFCTEMTQMTQMTHILLYVRKNL